MNQMNLTLAAVIGTVFFLGAFSSPMTYGQGTEQKKEKAAAPKMRKFPPVSVYVTKSTEMNETASHEYIGTVTGYAKVAIVARSPGYLLKLDFVEGGLVKKGQLLFEVEDTTYQAQVKSCRAKLTQMQAELEYATKNYERQKELKSREIVSKNNYEDAERLFHATKARVGEAEAALTDAENTLSYTKIYSPVNGRIGKSTYSCGNYVCSTSGALAEVIQITPTYVTFSMSERNFLEMFGTRQNMIENGVVRLIMADGKMFGETGVVKLLDNKVDDDTGTIKVWSTFQNTDLLLNPGSLVTVVISRKTLEKKTAVPAISIQTDANGNFVYSLNAEGKAIKIPVTLGDRVGSFQLLESGVKPGETIVVDGAHKIMMPGMPVIPIEAKK